MVDSSLLVHESYQLVRKHIPISFERMSPRAKNKQKIVPSDHKELIRGVIKIKEGLECAVEQYDHITLPPVYHQVRLQTSVN